jgi:P-type Cu+ transporter
LDWPSSRDIGKESTSVQDRIATDPVCRMKVDNQNPRGTHEYEGGTYYFCSAGCEGSLEKVPQKYLDSTY